MLLNIKYSVLVDNIASMFFFFLRGCPIFITYARSTNIMYINIECLKRSKHIICENRYKIKLFNLCTMQVSFN